MYHEYWDIGLKQDAHFWRQKNLVHQMRIVMPGVLSEEWNKTAGYFHTIGRYGLRYPELIEVLHGTGYILAQLMRTTDRIAETVLISLAAGDYILVPPGYGLSLINTGSVVLVTAHVFTRQSVPEYEEVARHRGLGYYIGPSGERPNPNYAEVPEIRRLYAKELRGPFAGFEGLYQTVSHYSDRFAFLSKPHILK